MIKALFIGESWFMYSVHQKGFDVFHTAEYVEGGTGFINTLNKQDISIDYIPAHKIEERFPKSLNELNNYRVIIISDVGANSFLLGKETFNQSKIVPNRLEAIKQYTCNGGGLLMIGGYLSFTGIDAKARYGESPLKDCLPVVTLPHDDRVEMPEGIIPEKTGTHYITDQLPQEWPPLLGYNRFSSKKDSHTLASIGADPLLVVGTHKKGRTAAFASDMAPHWAPPEFVNWEKYACLWSCLVCWLAKNH